VAKAERAPATFADSSGRVWRLEITAADIRPLRDAGLDLDKLNTLENRLTMMFGPEDGSGTAAAAETLFNAALILCEDQMNQFSPKLTPRELAKSLGGDVLGDLALSLSEAVILFSHRSNSATANAEIRAIRAAMSKADSATAEGIDEKVKAMELMSNAEISKASVGNLPAMSA